MLNKIFQEVLSLHCILLHGYVAYPFQGDRNGSNVIYTIIIGRELKIRKLCMIFFLKKLLGTKGPPSDDPIRLLPNFVIKPLKTASCKTGHIVMLFVNYAVIFILGSP